MSLIKCPECEQQVSDTALSCPHCGYVLKQENSSIEEDSVNCTPVGEFQDQPSLRISLIFLGGGLCFAGFIFLPFLIIGGFLLIMGFCVGEAANCSCPYCGKDGRLQKDSKGYKCPVCKKRSVYDVDAKQLKTVK